MIHSGLLTLRSVLRLHATCILNETTKPADPFVIMPQEPWHSGKVAKPDRVIQVNCRKVYINTSYKTTRTWDKFNNQETNIILPSNELWLIASNSKSFLNGSKATTSNNLGLCQHSEIYLTYNLKHIVMDLMV